MPRQRPRLLAIPRALRALDAARQCHSPPSSSAHDVRRSAPPTTLTRRAANASPRAERPTAASGTRDPARRRARGARSTRTRPTILLRARVRVAPRAAMLGHSRDARPTPAAWRCRSRWQFSESAVVLQTRMCVYVCSGSRVQYTCNTKPLSKQRAERARAPTRRSPHLYSISECRDKTRPRFAKTQRRQTRSSLSLTPSR